MDRNTFTTELYATGHHACPRPGTVTKRSKFEFLSDPGAFSDSGDATPYTSVCWWDIAGKVSGC